MKDIELGRVLFDKQVVMRTVDNRVDCAQKELVKRAFMDYHRRYMRALDEKAQRLRMENDHLLQQYRKHLSSIRSLGREGSVNPHDFFEAEIRCKKSLSQITNLVHTCSELKRHAVRCSNECRRVKHILHEKLRTIGQLEVECTRRRKAAQSLHDQIEVTAKQCSKAQKKKKHYTLVLANMSAPPVSEFVSKVGELHFLIQKLQDKRRKKELAELSLKAHRRAWSRLCQ
ncbi:unnamed protein product [Calicophoron daubneyi]|uniref:Uncharacterized protein n=1 Tax=Calicophoron daubneyi TaxID=300641 RepID=A0AAV2TEH1_CALDB